MLALEVVEVTVSDVDRAKAFYRDLVGFHVDIDYAPSPQFRVVQLTAPGSHCSIHLISADPPTRAGRLFLVTEDLIKERERLLRSGVEVSPIVHKEPVETWGGAWSEGLDPQRGDYASVANFVDLDGNAWIVQERGFRKA